MLLLRKPVLLFCVAAIFVVALVPVAPLFLAPLTFLAVFAAATVIGVRRGGLLDHPFRPAVLALVLAPHRPRAALFPARS